MGPADAEHIFRLNEDPEVLRHVHDAPFADRAAAARWIAAIDQELPLGIGRWAITTTDDKWIGRCSLRKQPHGEVLMGYRLLRAEWNKGYASEAVAALLQHAFHVHRLPSVLSVIAPGNMGSRRVAEKNGGVAWPEAGAYSSYGLVHRFERPAG